MHPVGVQLAGGSNRVFNSDSIYQKLYIASAVNHTYQIHSAIFMVLKIEISHWYSFWLLKKRFFAIIIHY